MITRSKDGCVSQAALTPRISRAPTTSYPAPCKTAERELRSESPFATFKILRRGADIPVTPMENEKRVSRLFLSVNSSRRDAAAAGMSRRNRHRREPFFRSIVGGVNVRPWNRSLERVLDRHHRDRWPASLEPTNHGFALVVGCGPAY